jgi:Protein of unknown function (DUF3307)
VSTGPLIWLLAVHYLGDYVFQSRWMGNNKSKRLDALGLHVAIYTATLAVCLVPFAYQNWSGWCAFVLLNGAAHFATDYVTSRAVARLWAEKREYETFAIMGLDQFIHQATLIASSWLLVQR